MSDQPRSLAGGALLATIGRVSWAVAAAVVTVIVARLLGPDGSGQFAVISGLFFALLVATTLGLELGIAWMVGSRRWSTGGALLAGALASLVLGGIGAALGLGIRALAADTAFAGVDADAMLPAAAGLPAAILVVVFIQAAIASDSYEAAAAIAVSQAGGYVVGAAAMTALFDLVGAAAGLLAGQLTGATVALVWAARVVSSEGRPSFDRARLRQAIAFGVPLYVANAVAIVIYRLDIFLVNAYSGNSEAGYYAVAIAATTTLGLLPAALGSVLFPRLASYSEGDEAQRRDLEDRALRHTALILLVSSALLAVTAPLLFEPVFGPEFGPAVAPALMLIPGAAALGLATILYSALAGRGRPGYALRFAAVVGPLAIGLYFLLIPALGAEGAAIGSDIGYICSAALAAVALRRISGQSPPRRLRPGREEIRDYRQLAVAVRERLARR